MMIALFVLSWVTCVWGQEVPPPEQSLQARVDPRVELMSIIFRLAGNPEYNMDNSKSPYSDEVEKQFGLFRNHPAVQTARQLRSQHGVSYDAVMSMAVHLTDAIGLQEKIPFDQKPQRLDQRWPLEETRRFLTQARQFVKDSGFENFCTDHRKFFDDCGKRLTAQLAKGNYVQWFDKFFGQRPRASYEVYVGLLNGGGCYGVGIRYRDGKEEITPVIGAYEFDSQGLAVFDDRINETIVHEFCHSYTNAYVDKHADELQKAGERIYQQCADEMKSQAYGTWKTVIYESMVRACTVRYVLATDGKKAADRVIKDQREWGFEWVGELADVLGDYESNRQQYPDLEAFMPRIVKFFNIYADQYGKKTEKLPHVVQMVPANGMTDVDPKITEIRITFSCPMRDKSWSVVGGGPNFPEIAGDISYDADRKILTIPVKLKPSWEYEFWLNRGKFDSFQSDSGERLKPVHVTFKTRAAGS